MKVRVKCQQCGAEREVYPSLARPYCSRKCFAASMIGRSVSWARQHLNPDFFYSQVSRSDGCWEWQGHRNAKGYGHISVNNKLVLAHRHAWTLSVGPIPEGMFVLHHCDNPPCVRIEHLYIGTKSDNALDRERRGRGYNQRRKSHAA